VWFDLDAQQEAIGRRELEVAGQHAAQRRGTRTHRKPAPVAPAPVAHLGRDRTPRRAQIAGWAAAELTATNLKYANMATPRT